jgi:hypothetical protein
MEGLGMVAADSELPEWDDWARRPYLVEISRQCAMAMEAAAELFEAVSQEGIHLAAWYSAQAFLGATANVSKLLKPPQPRSTHMARLAELLGVEDAAPSLQRGVRNHFEHLDARIDEWLWSQRRPTAEELERGDFQAFADLAPPPLRIIRPEDGVIAFRDEELDVPAILEELGRILNAVQEIEPLARVHPDLGALLAVLPYYPHELRLDAPSRRPDEPVTTGIEVEAAHSL